MNKKYSTLVLMIVIVTGCNGNGRKSSDSSTMSTNKISHKSVSQTGSKLQGIDLLSLNFSGTQLKSPVNTNKLKSASQVESCPQKVCIKESIRPTVHFINTGHYGYNWTSREIPFKLTFKFDESMPGFYLKGMQNDIPSEHKYSIGHISGIDSSNCTNSSKTAGTSCYIVMAYSGDVIPGYDTTEVINLYFSDNKGQTIIYPLTVASQRDNENEIRAVLTTLNNDIDGIIRLTNYPTENHNQVDQGLIHDRNYKLVLHNYGDGDIPSNPGSPSIDVEYGTSLNADPLDWFYNSLYVTSCGDSRIAPAQSNVTSECNMYFTNTPADKIYKTSFGRLVFYYNTNNSDQFLINRVIIGSGDFQNLEESRTHLTLPATLSINKKVIGDGNRGNLVYIARDENFLLALEINPAFDIGYSISGNKGEYFYGEIKDLNTNTIVTTTDVLNNINLIYDSKCFEDNIILNDQDPLATFSNGPSCTVQISYKHAAKYSIPVKTMLFASYASKIDGFPHKQYLGDLIIK